MVGANHRRSPSRQAPGTGEVRTILATGGRGQVGTELAKLAWPADCAVHLIDLPEVDLRDPAAIARKMDERPWDAVLSVGAYTAVDQAETDVVAAWQVNALAPASFAAACGERDIPLIQVSTDYVFDGSKTEPWRETDATGPLGVYGASKLGGELAVRSGCRRHAVVRTSWVVSAHGHNFVKTMLRLGAERDRIGVVADQRGAPTSATDLASAIAQIALKMIDDKEAPAGVFHFSNAGETTWHGLAEEIFAVGRGIGGPAPEVAAITTSNYPTPARRPANSLLANDAIRDAYGIAARPWQEAIADIVSAILKG